MIFYDTETCGLHGMAVLIQYAYDDGPIQLFSPWTRPIHETLKLITDFMEHEEGIVGFNLVFDQFHLCKLYNVFSLWHDHNEIPENIINELAELEMQARDGPCLKPVKACDLMLHARKGPYQSTMERSPIRIKRIPTSIAWQVAAELDRRITFNAIYFANKENPNERWVVHDIEREGVMNPDFKDIVLSFSPSNGLKALAQDALGVKDDELLLFGSVEVPKQFRPVEFGYAPFAKAAGGNRLNWKGAWPEVIQKHIDHWAHYERARKYAADDVDYTRRLYKFFKCPELGDDDSELACMVAPVRWKGFKLDLPKLRQLRENMVKQRSNIPTDWRVVHRYISEVMTPTEKAVFQSTKKVVLQDMATWHVPCPVCNREAETELEIKDIHAEVVEDFDAPGQLHSFKINNKITQEECSHCNKLRKVLHPAAVRAREVIAARAAEDEIELFDKLLLAGRFHASFKVIGTLSSRMSGADKLNPQGIKKTKEVRSCFPLAHDGLHLDGGDFSGFEVTLAEACYNDENLRKDLLTCEKCENQMRFVHERNDFICTSCGSNKSKKIHALFGINVFPDMTYEQIKATEGTTDDKYTKSKQAVFAMFYGGEGFTLKERLGVDIEIANIAYQRFTKKYPGVGIARAKIFDMFCSMRQPKGIGTKVEWHEPHDYIESMFGFRRYFTLENRVCKALFDIANKPPKAWQNAKIKVMRRDREQTASGAAQSAIYAAAFAVQASDMRAAANHVIQSSGAQITKKVQRNIWSVQPSGIHPWLVQAMNIHDEIMAVTHESVRQRIKEIVNETVESFRPKVPLIRMDWVLGLKTWAEKG